MVVRSYFVRCCQWKFLELHGKMSFDVEGAVAEIKILMRGKWCTAPKTKARIGSKRVAPGFCFTYLTGARSDARIRYDHQYVQCLNHLLNRCTFRQQPIIEIPCCSTDFSVKLSLVSSTKKVNVFCWVMALFLLNEGVAFECLGNKGFCLMLVPFAMVVFPAKIL